MAAAAAASKTPECQTSSQTQKYDAQTMREMLDWSFWQNVGKTMEIVKYMDSRKGMIAALTVGIRPIVFPGGEIKSIEYLDIEGIEQVVRELVAKVRDVHPVMDPPLTSFETNFFGHTLERRALYLAMTIVAEWYSDKDSKKRTREDLESLAEMLQHWEPTVDDADEYVKYVLTEMPERIKYKAGRYHYGEPTPTLNISNISLKFFLDIVDSFLNNLEDIHPLSLKGNCNWFYRMAVHEHTLRMLIKEWEVDIHECAEIDGEPALNYWKGYGKSTPVCEWDSYRNDSPAYSPCHIQN